MAIQKPQRTGPKVTVKQITNILSQLSAPEMNDIFRVIDELVDAVNQSSSGNSMTDAEVKTAYENNTNTNAFTDTLKTKLDTINSIEIIYASRALTSADNGKMLLVSTDVNLILNSTSFAALPNAFSCVIRYDKSASGGLSLAGVDTEVALGVTEFIDLSLGGSQYFFKLGNKLYQLN